LVRVQLSSRCWRVARNGGIGVRRPPLARRVASSARPDPPRKVHRLVRFAGGIGGPHSSFSSEREGPSARPSVPWHLWHSIASNISLPRFIDSADEATSLGSSSFFGASLNLSAAKLLMYATRFQRSLSGSTAHEGIEVPGIPSVMIRKRS